jgi:hypothetical protein
VVSAAGGTLPQPQCKNAGFLSSCPAIKKTLTQVNQRDVYVDSGASGVHHRSLSFEALSV